MRNLIQVYVQHAKLQKRLGNPICVKNDKTFTIYSSILGKLGKYSLKSFSNKGEVKKH